ncbi:MAG: hypothetical protein ACI8TQ_000958 [Planctomycetota bacterium]|jgi:hypothetical protein
MTRTKGRTIQIQFSLRKRITGLKGLDVVLEVGHLVSTEVEDEEDQHGEGQHDGKDDPEPVLFEERVHLSRSGR